MFYKAYTILDLKSGVHSQPFFQIHDGVAQRMFMDTARDPGTTIGLHPEDFVLYRFGEFDDHLAQFSSHAPVNLGLAAALLGRASPRVGPSDIKSLEETFLDKESV